MVRTLERPDEGSELREMRLEGLEGVLEHTRNALLQAGDEGDVEQARVWAAQRDGAAAELLARGLERRRADRQAEATGQWPEDEDEY